VLRGEKSSFHLVGNIVNTAGRMENTGVRNRIHLSQETANCLIDQGKGHWLKPRTGIVPAKGKNVMQTYWIDLSHLIVKHGGLPVRLVGCWKRGNKTLLQSMKKTKRLIDWNVDVLQRLLKNNAAMRDAKPRRTSSKIEEADLKIETSGEATILD
jgi:hypothetical protein